MANRILVTGASGFLGQEIVRHIYGKYPVYATGRRAIQERSADYIPADILNDDIYECLPRDVDTVIHTAADIGGTERAADQSFNIARRMIDWGVKGGSKNFILVSSAAVYERSNVARDETFACNPRSAYGRSKLRSEKYIIAASKQARMRLVILRMPALVGPTLNGSIARLIVALRKGRFVWFGTGRNQKSLLNVSDAGLACLATVDYLLQDKRCESDQSIFNVIGGTMSMAKIISLICDELGRNRPRHLPAVLATAPISLLSGIVTGVKPFDALLASVDQFLSNDVLDGSLFQEQVGFEAANDIQQSIIEMVRYHR